MDSIPTIPTMPAIPRLPTIERICSYGSVIIPQTNPIRQTGEATSPHSLEYNKTHDGIPYTQLGPIIGYSRDLNYITLSFHNGYVIKLTIGDGVNGVHNKDHFLGSYIENIQIRVYINESEDSDSSDDDYYDTDEIGEVVCINLRLPNGETFEDDFVLTTYYDGYDLDTSFEKSIKYNTVDVFSPLTATKRAR
jgi:hypothetical protein